MDDFSKTIREMMKEMTIKIANDNNIPNAFRVLAYATLIAEINVKNVSREMELEDMDITEEDVETCKQAYMIIENLASEINEMNDNIENECKGEA